MKKLLFVATIVFVALTGCKKDPIVDKPTTPTTQPEQKTLPTLTTAAATSISATSATLGGNISNAGTPAYTERGVCWSTSQNPTTAGSKQLISGSGTGDFSTTVQGLTASTTYYVRAYAINTEGTAYGSEVFFTTSAETPPPASFPEFQSLQFFDGLWFRYDWEYSATSSGTKKGSITVRLQAAGMVNINGASVQEYTRTDEFTGDEYPYDWRETTRMAMHNGTIWFTDVNPPYAAFNSMTGEAGNTGFTGHMSSGSVRAEDIDNPLNPFYSGKGAAIAYSFYKPSCETIAGVQICDNYSVTISEMEYYHPLVGFCGYTYDNTGIFSNWPPSTVKTNMKLWLSSSNIFSIVPCTGNLPAVPTNLTATGLSGSQIFLAWTDNADNESGYIVERSPDGGYDWTEVAALEADAVYWVDTDVVPLTTYYYRVRAKNDCGYSDYSNTASDATLDASAEKAPILWGPTTTSHYFTLYCSYDWPEPHSSTYDRFYLEASNESPSSGYEYIEWAYGYEKSSFDLQVDIYAAEAGEINYIRVYAYRNDSGTNSPYSNVWAITYYPESYGSNAHSGGAKAAKLSIKPVSAKRE